MRRRDHAGGKPDATDRSAEQPRTHKTASSAAVARAQPDGSAGSEVRHGEAVWDQPLPWVTPGDDGQDASAAPQAQPPQAEPPQAQPPQAQRDADGESTTAQADGAASHAQCPAEERAAVAAASPTPEAPRPAARRRSHSERATPAPLSAGAVGSLVSRRVLGVAAAVGGLLAAVGGVIAFHPGPSAAHVKQEAAPVPVLGPAEGGGGAATPTPSATSPAATHAATHAAKSPRGAAAHVDKSTSAATHSAAGRPGSDHAAGAIPVVDHLARPLAAEATRPQPQSSLSVSTSVYAKNPYWSQSTVTVTTKTRLSALKVVVRVYQTGGVESTGTWTSLGDEVTVHSAADSQALDYVVTLNAGVTLNPGTYTFEFQYNHAEGTRGTGRDLYVVTATAPGATSTESKQGGF